MFLQGTEAKKDEGMTHSPQRASISPLELTLSMCVDHQGVSTATELLFGTTRELKFINSFYYLILLFCGAQLQIL